MVYKRWSIKQGSFGLLYDICEKIIKGILNINKKLRLGVVALLLLLAVVLAPLPVEASERGSVDCANDARTGDIICDVNDPDGIKTIRVFDAEEYDKHFALEQKGEKPGEIEPEQKIPFKCDEVKSAQVRIPGLHRSHSHYIKVTDCQDSGKSGASRLWWYVDRDGKIGNPTGSKFHGESKPQGHRYSKPTGQKKTASGGPNNGSIDRTPPSVYPLYSTDDFGIIHLKVSDLVNAEITVEGFPPTTVPQDYHIFPPKNVTYSRNKTDRYKPASYRITATDIANQTTTACPLFLQLSREPGKPVNYNGTLTSTESIFEINNSGVTDIQVNINGNKFQIKAHPNKRGQEGNTYFIPEYGEYTIDLSPYMVRGNNNISLEARGEPDGSAEILIREPAFPVMAGSEGASSNSASAAEPNKPSTVSMQAYAAEGGGNTGNTGYAAWYYYIEDMVNSANGNLYLYDRDTSIRARGFNLEVIRSYNSLSNATDGPLGYGWTHSYNVKLVENPDLSVTMYDGDGAVYKFTNVSGNYVTPAGMHSNLTKSDGGFVLRFKHGEVYNFNPAGVLLNITDTNGNTLNFTYTSGLLTRVEDNSGLNITFNYNANNRISNISAINAKITYEYDASGNLIKVTDAMGYSTLYFYYSDHRLKNTVDGVNKGINIIYNNDKVVEIWNGLYNGTAFNNFFRTDYIEYGNNIVNITDSRGYKISVELNSNKNPVKITNPLGYYVLKGWDVDMNMISYTDANGNTNTHQYDFFGNLVNETDPTGNSTLYGYNNINTQEKYISLIVNTTNARGFTTYYGYDVYGNLNNTIDATGNRSNRAYNSYGYIINETDARGYTITYTYDDHGYRNRSIDPTGNITTYTYDAFGRLLNTTDANGNTTSNEYNANGWLIKITDATWNTTTSTYNAIGSLIGTADENGYLTSYGKNIVGKTDEITDATGNKTSNLFDKNGNEVRSTDAKGINTYQMYDALNRLISVTDALGNTESYTYDAVGNLLSKTDTNGHITRYEYDKLNRPVKTIDATGNYTLQSYDAVGNLISSTDASGHSTTLEYDALNRQVKSTDVLGHTIYSKYDEDGNLINRTDANGNSVLYSYDALGRLVLAKYPDGSNISYSYDANSNQISIKDKNVNAVYIYDALNRLTEENWTSHGWYVRYSYDAVGNRIRMQDHLGDVTTYTYDSLNRPENITDPKGNVTKFNYDAAGNRIKLIYPNGVEADYIYDSTNRLTRLVNKKGSTYISNFTYGYDRVGNRMYMTESNGVVKANTTYNYDSIYRLIEANKTGYENWNERYTYDAVGNRLKLIRNGQETSYFYDAANRLVNSTSASGTTYYTYDTIGNLINKSFSGSSTLYSYDIENRLVKITFPDATTNEFNYSALGKRIAKKDKTGRVKQYFYDGDNVLLEFNPDFKYVTSLNIDDILFRFNSTDELYYHRDGLSSTTDLSNLSGSEIGNYTYSPFGVLLSETGIANINDYSYTGREYDRESGLYYYRARYYDAETGRFLSKDPLEYVDGMNLYTYVGNDPINTVDPDGTKKKRWRRWISVTIVIPIIVITF